MKNKSIILQRPFGPHFAHLFILFLFAFGNLSLALGQQRKAVTSLKAPVKNGAKSEKAATRDGKGDLYTKGTEYPSLFDCNSTSLADTPTADQPFTLSFMFGTGDSGLPNFFEEGNISSFDEFQFIFGNGIVATQDQDAADQFGLKLGVGLGKRCVKKVGAYYPLPKSDDKTFFATIQYGYIGYNGKIYRTEKEYNSDPSGNVWITLEEFGKYPPNMGGACKLVLK